MGWYYIVTEEMLALGLRGSELNIFAIIHGFSQKQGGCYYGGNVLLAEMTGMTEKSVRQILHRMLDKGLLKREPIRRNGKDMFAYSTGEKFSGVTGEFSSGVRGKKVPLTGEKSSPNNKVITETTSPKKGKEIEDLVLPFSSDDFLAAWGELTRQPKWRKKTQSALQKSLDKLGKYTEPVAIVAINDSIAGDWQGIFPERAKIDQQVKQEPARVVSAKDFFHK